MQPQALPLRPRLCIVGATGYAGQELLRLLAGHTHVGRVSTAPSREGPDGIPADADWVFLATPAETSAALAGPLVARGQRVIDLSGAHRAGSAAQHEAAYRFAHPHPALLAEAVYGFAAAHERLQTARLIANPGCYANALLSALLPLRAAGIVEPRAVVDATGISGVSGAGRTPTERTMYMYVAENLAPYRTGRDHQHIVEVEACANVHLLFVPMVAPLRRGMLVSGSVDVSPWIGQNPTATLPPLQLGNDPLWHQVATAPDVLGVTGQNIVRVHYDLDKVARRVQFVSVIDNLLRGAASHAVYNLNLACGWPALSGLQEGISHG